MEVSKPESQATAKNKKERLADYCEQIREKIERIQLRLTVLRSTSSLEVERKVVRVLEKDIEGQHRRLEALERMKAGQAISQDSLDHLMKIEELKEDPVISEYNRISSKKHLEDCCEKMKRSVDEILNERGRFPRKVTTFTPPELRKYIKNLDNQIEAQQKRLETLEKMKAGQTISLVSLDHLMKIEELKEDPVISEYNRISSKKQHLEDYCEKMKRSVNETLNERGRFSRKVTTFAPLELRKHIKNLDNQIEGQQKRLETLERMKAGQTISQDSLDHLMMIEELKEDPVISEYNNRISSDTTELEEMTKHLEELSIKMIRSADEALYDLRRCQSGKNGDITLPWANEEEEELRNVFKAQEKRVETLEKMKDGQPISQDSLDHLMEMEEFKGDSILSQYNSISPATDTPRK